MITSILAKVSHACWIGATASLILASLAGAARASDGNVIALKQLGTGAQGASIYINQVGLRNVLSGPGSIVEADWQVLNDHPDISSSPLFVRSGAQAIVGSDVLLNLTQEGDDNSLALLGQGTDSAVPGQNQVFQILMDGNSNKAEIIPTATNPQNISIGLSLIGDSNLARLRPEVDGTLTLDVQGNGNEFILKQNSGTIASEINVLALGDGHSARLRQDGSNLSLNLTFEGTGVGPLELLQTGSNFDFTATYNSNQFGSPYNVAVGSGN